MVMNVTVRSMKLHGGARDRWNSPVIQPSRLKTWKQPPSAPKPILTGTYATGRWGSGCRSINRFASTPMALAAIAQFLPRQRSSVCITEVHAKGGEGGKDLAEAVVKAVQNHVAAGRPFVPMFTPETDVLTKQR